MVKNKTIKVWDGIKKGDLVKFEMYNLYKAREGMFRGGSFEEYAEKDYIPYKGMVMGVNLDILEIQYFDFKRTKNTLELNTCEFGRENSKIRNLEVIK